MITVRQKWTYQKRIFNLTGIMCVTWGMNDGQCLTIKEVFWTCSDINQSHEILK